MNKNTDLKQWNLKQKELWLKLVDQGLVDRRDCKTFRVFANIFCWYEEQFDCEPTFKDMVLFLGLNHN